MAEVCKRAFVAGRVQGVWFRGSTQEKARALALVGWVRNLADGRVEVLVRGPEAAVAELEHWLQRGPPLARVDRLTVSEEPLQHFSDFTIG